MVLRRRNHCISAGAERAFPIGLFFGKRQRKDALFVDCCGILIRIDCADEREGFLRSGRFRDLAESSGIIPGLSIKLKLLILSRQVEDGNLVIFVPENLDVFIDINSRI